MDAQVVFHKKDAEQWNRAETRTSWPGSKIHPEGFSNTQYDQT